MDARFINQGYELEHNWEESEAQKVTKEEAAEIKYAQIRQGKYGLQLDLHYKDGRNPVRHNWSSTAPQYEAGQKIRVSSLTFTMLTDTVDGSTKLVASGEAL